MFMILLSSSISTVQLMILGLGVHGIVNALVFAVICFAVSIVRMFVVERAIRKSGRVSFVVGRAGGRHRQGAQRCRDPSRAARVWAQYSGGEYMRFNPPC
ncbi:unnamed protein product [Urochloa humidicola]